MKELTEEETLQRGAAASALLQDPTFKLYFDELEQATLECIGNTLPYDTAVRENLYFQLYGLRNLRDTMRSEVDAARAIQARNETEQESD